MSRISTLIWLLVVVVAAFLLYTVKYQVQALKSQIAATGRQLETEKEALHVVAAEWAYLNRPDRLQALAARHLTNQAEVTASQVAEIALIPFPAQTEASLQDAQTLRPVAARGHAARAVP